MILSDGRLKFQKIQGKWIKEAKWLRCPFFCSHPASAFMKKICIRKMNLKVIQIRYYKALKSFSYLFASHSYMF